VKIINGARPAAVVALLIVAAALGVAACGGSSSGAGAPGSRVAYYRSCLEKYGVTFRAGDTLASRISQEATSAPVMKDCLDATLRQPLSQTTIKLLTAYVSCVSKHGYNLPTPNTSGNGPVFPPGTGRIRKYRAAATNCVPIERAELRSMYGTA
jgi:hypothetical protein